MFCFKAPYVVLRSPEGFAKSKQLAIFVMIYQLVDR